MEEVEWLNKDEGDGVNVGNKIRTLSVLRHSKFKFILSKFDLKLIGHIATCSQVHILEFDLW